MHETLGYIRRFTAMGYPTTGRGLTANINEAPIILVVGSPPLTLNP